MNLVLCFRRDQFMEKLENEELNRELCALAVDDMFESWSPETQDQILAEWNDWNTTPSRFMFVINVVKSLPVHTI